MKIKLIVLMLISSTVLGACMDGGIPAESALAADSSLQPVEEEAVPSIGFEKTFWVLEDLNGAKAVGEDEGGQPATLHYDPETGNLAGTTGCNQYFADAQVDPEAGTIKLGMIGMTRMACRGPIADQEIAFVSLLEKIARYEISGSQLTLLAEDGQALVFNAAGE